MNRLQSEVCRLYLPRARAGQDGARDEPGLIDADGKVRAMVLELSRPADWESISKVWQGVQVDLDLPAPAIAVSGVDGYQLWFSLSAPVPAAQAIAFLDALRLRYLGEVKPQCIGLMPTVDAASPLQVLHARRVPAPQAHSGHWSAFVAPDLAPVFAEEPWLDIPPNPDGQANLLARLVSIPPADFDLALERLRPAAAAVQSVTASSAAQAAVAGMGAMPARPALQGEWLDPKRFLLDVMNTDAVDLHLRIEAAKALLPHIG